METPLLTAEQNKLLTEVDAGTPMGDLLRRYWFPFAGASEFEQKHTMPVRLLGENLVAYRDLSGNYGLIDRHCPHRRADLSYGYVETCGLRCNYHGWLLNHHGDVAEIAYDDLVHPEQELKSLVRVKAYPVKECAGLLFAYMGPAPAPELPVWEPLTWKDGFSQIVKSNIPCNWFQCQENSCDPVHFEWMHENWINHLNGSDVNSAPRHLRLTFEEVGYGHVYRRIREGQDEQSPHWTIGRLALWPNGFYLGEHFEWRVPIDSENTLSICWFYDQLPIDAPAYVQTSIPTWLSPIKNEAGEWLTDHILNQDFLAWVGQGVIADRTKEFLAASDRGIVMMRRRYMEEMKKVKDGQDPKGVIRDPDAAKKIPLGIVGRSRATGRLTRAQWKRDPYLSTKLVDHRHCAGQPPEVRRMYLEAVGFSENLDLL